MCCCYIHCSFFFFNDPAPTDIYTLSLHDALPISTPLPAWSAPRRSRCRISTRWPGGNATARPSRDRKSTRLNSSHVEISYAVFCLKKQKKKNITKHPNQPDQCICK